MKVAVLLLSAVIGTWFWQRPVSSGRLSVWPESMPAFANGVPDSAYATNGGGTFVCTTVPGGRDEALERVRAAFVGAGWSMAPIRTRDMLVFARGDAVAAVLAEEVAAGTRLTAIQRKSGL